MKKLIACILPACALLVVSSMAGRADEFSQIANNPNTFWVPDPTPPPPGYVAGSPPYGYYGPPPPAYYGPPPPVFYGPPIFFHFHFH